MNSVASFVLVLGVIAVIPAEIARRKGHRFWEWWIAGVLVWVVALPLALRAEDKTHVACPYCREPMRPDATKCPHCRSDFYVPTSGDVA